MPLMTRLARLLRADLHALLDRLEEPGLVLAQAIREMEQALAQERRDLAVLEVDRRRVERQISEFDQGRARTEEALETCLSAGRDELARPVVRRRLIEERRVVALERRRAALDEDLERRMRRLEERSTRLADLRAQASAVESEPEEIPDGDVDDRWGYGDGGIRETDVDLALLQAKRQRGLTA